MMKNIRLLTISYLSGIWKASEHPAGILGVGRLSFRIARTPFFCYTIVNQIPAMHVQLTYFEPTLLSGELKLECDVYACKGSMERLTRAPTCIYADSK